MSVKYINVGDGGLVKNVEVRDGTTIEDFIADNNGDMDGSVVRVNGDAAEAGQILGGDDRVTVTPANIKGA